MEHDDPKLNLLKVKFNRAMKASREFFTSLRELTEEEKRIYGFVHNERDLDYIIDVVDYATGTMTFKLFHKQMMDEKAAYPDGRGDEGMRE